MRKAGSSSRLLPRHSSQFGAFKVAHPDAQSRAQVGVRLGHQNVHQKGLHMVR